MKDVVQDWDVTGNIEHQEKTHISRKLLRLIEIRIYKLDIKFNVSFVLNIYIYINHIIGK